MACGHAGDLVAVSVRVVDAGYHGGLCDTEVAGTDAVDVRDDEPSVVEQRYRAVTLESRGVGLDLASLRSSFEVKDSEGEPPPPIDEGSDVQAMA